MIDRRFPPERQPDRTLNADDGRDLRREIAEAMNQARDARSSIATHMASCAEHNKNVEQALERLTTIVTRLILLFIAFAVIDLGIVKLPELVSWIAALK